MRRFNMHQPKFFIHDRSLVYGLNKSLYGLKQSPRAWYTNMDNFLLLLGFERWKSDPNVYLKNIGDSLHVIVLYVDDIFMTGSFIDDIGSIKSSFHSEFSMIDLGLLKQFLGLEIEKYYASIKVIQSNYGADLLLTFKMYE